MISYIIAEGLCSSFVFISFTDVLGLLQLWRAISPSGTPSAHAAYLVYTYKFPFDSLPYNQSMLVFSYTVASDNFFLGYL